MALELLEASKIGDIRKVQQLLQEVNVDVNQIDADQYSPLHWASLNGHHAVVILLLQHVNIDINQYCENGCTLYMAIANHHTSIIELLLQTPNINVNNVHLRGDTPLKLASGKGQTDTVASLLTHPDIQVNQSCSLGFTPLAMASIRGHYKIVELLLQEKHIVINPVNAFNQTPLDSSSENGHFKVVELLLRKYAVMSSCKSIPKKFNIKVRLMYMLYRHKRYDQRNQTSKEIKLVQTIKSFNTTLQMTLINTQLFCNDIANIIYKFACPSSYLQIMEILEL